MPAKIVFTANPKEKPMNNSAAKKEAKDPGDWGKTAESIFTVGNRIRLTARVKPILARPGTFRSLKMGMRNKIGATRITTKMKD
jgi:hypothetical protein